MARRRAPGQHVRGAGAAQHGGDPGDDLVDVERSGDVAVAEPERADDFGGCVPRGGEDGARLGRRRPPFAPGFAAVAVRQYHVEQHGVRADRSARWRAWQTVAAVDTSTRGSAGRLDRTPAMLGSSSTTRTRAPRTSPRGGWLDPVVRAVSAGAARCGRIEAGSSLWNLAVTWESWGSSGSPGSWPGVLGVGRGSPFRSPRRGTARSMPGPGPGTGPGRPLPRPPPGQGPGRSQVRAEQRGHGSRVPPATPVPHRRCPRRPVATWAPGPPRIWAPCRRSTD